MRKVFISKPSTETHELQDYCENRQWDLQAQSLITFRFVPFTIQHPFEIVFFTSPRSVEYFLKGSGVPKSCLIACTGEGTAQILRDHGLNPDFVGKGSDAPEIGRSFRIFANGRRVLFPISVSSLRSISMQLEPGTFEEVIVYETISNSALIADKDIYIFSSPSNYRSFKEKNSLPAKAVVIAWGTSTARSLSEDGAHPMVLSDSNMQSLLSFLDTI